MKVWIFESNLIWSSRFVNTVRGSGHEAIVTSVLLEESAEVAIVNLSDPNVGDLVNELTKRGIYTIAHAGHKEKDLIELGKQIKVNRVATNSEITNKLPKMLEESIVQKS